MTARFPHVDGVEHRFVDVRDVEDSGHFIAEEKPELVAERILGP